MKFKTAELEGQALTTAVAFALGYEVESPPEVSGTTVWRDRKHNEILHGFTPSLMQIMEEGKIEVWYARVVSWYAIMFKRDPNDFHEAVIGTGKGPDPYLAVMRCFVDGRIGAEIDIPEELL